MRSFATLILVLLLGACAPKAHFAQGTAQIADKVKLQIEIAETPDALEQGLMHRQQLLADHGMLFILADYNIASFWMHNTEIPLDILFFDTNGKLVEIQANRQPHDEVPQYTRQAVKYVLEINAGQAAANNILIGDQIIWKKNR